MFFGAGETAGAGGQLDVHANVGSNLVTKLARGIEEPVSMNGLGVDAARRETRYVNVNVRVERVDGSGGRCANALLDVRAEVGFGRRSELDGVLLIHRPTVKNEEQPV